MLEGEGYEMFYSNDLYLLYLLHIEGGGKTAFLKDQEGKDYYLSYDGTNSQPFRFISTYMKEKGMLTDDLSIKAQKDYLAKHPEVQEEVFSSCANYVYFKKTTTPPLGSDNVSLTDNRSIATDKNLYAQKGVLTFVESRRPLEGQDPGDKDLKWQEFSRFFIDQDTGGAIRGKARADLYFGLGEYAELASHTQKEYGRIFFLMPKDI
jgi:membrane-bound lytic murein transglycosylase A